MLSCCEVPWCIHHIMKPRVSLFLGPCLCRLGKISLVLRSRVPWIGGEGADGDPRIEGSFAGGFWPQTGRSFVPEAARRQWERGGKGAPQGAEANSLSSFGGGVATANELGGSASLLKDCSRPLGKKGSGRSSVTTCHARVLIPTRIWPSLASVIPGEPVGIEM